MDVLTARALSAIVAGLEEALRALLLALAIVHLVAVPAWATATLALPGTFQNISILGHQFVAPNSGMTPPRAVRFTPPEYTAEALRDQVEGVVTVLAEFDIDGNFRVIRIEKGLGHGLDRKAIEAMLNWQFSPAYRSGRRVAAIANVDVVFRLSDINQNLRGFIENFWSELVPRLESAHETTPDREIE